MNSQNLRTIKVVAIAFIVFAFLFSYYVYDTRDSGMLLKEIFYPDLSSLKEVDVQFTDRNYERRNIKLRTSSEIKEFVKLISRSYENQINPNGSRYYGNDIVTYFFTNHEVKYMISLEKGGEVHARIYSSVTKGWHFGRYRVDGFIDFISSRINTHNKSFQPTGYASG